MQSVNTTLQERILALYSRVKKENGELSALNNAGIRRFSEIGYPGRKAEMFTYVNTAKPGLPGYDKTCDIKPDTEGVTNSIYQGFEQNTLVFTNGVYDKSLSNISALPARILRFGAGASKPGSEISSYMMNAVNQESDPFAALNAAFHREIIVIDFSGGTGKKRDLQILYHSSGDGKVPPAFTPRIFLKVPARTEFEIIARFTGSSADYSMNSFQDLVIGNNATIHFLLDQSAPSESTLLVKNRITVNEGARCFFTQVLSGSGMLTRCNNEIILKGAGAVFESKSTSVLTRKEEAHTYMTLSHHAKNCRSNQFFNNIVLQKGRVSVDTTVEVKKEATGTESGQLIKNTLLSKEARADSKPNLRIFTDDVKCQHGATTGSLDEKQILYMQSRGVSRRSAKNAVITGLVDSMLTDIRDVKVRASVRKELVNKIGDKDV